jgi:hypothetical protein
MWGGTASSALRLSSSRLALGATRPHVQRAPGRFPRVKWQGRGVEHPPPSSAEVKKRVKLHLYSPSGPSWPVLGRTLPFYVCLIFDLTHVTKRKTKWVRLMKSREWMYILKQFLTYLIQGRAKEKVKHDNTFKVRYTGYNTLPRHRSLLK